MFQDVPAYIYYLGTNCNRPLKLKHFMHLVTYRFIQALQTLGFAVEVRPALAGKQPPAVRQNTEHVLGTRLCAEGVVAELHLGLRTARACPPARRRGCHGPPR